MFNTPHHDPFNGLGDFFINPVTSELMAERACRQEWQQRAISQELTLKTAGRLLIPVRKATKKDLERQIELAREEIERALLEV